MFLTVDNNNSCDMIADKKKEQSQRNINRKQNNCIDISREELKTLHTKRRRHGFSRGVSRVKLNLLS